MAGSAHRLKLVLTATSMVAAIGLGSLPAFAQLLLGDTPANLAALSPTCTKIQFLGPMITAWCSDKDDLMFKSEVDVRSCAGYQVVVDGSGHIRCRARARR
jgi:hypothetical protein